MVVLLEIQYSVWENGGLTRNTVQDMGEWWSY